MLFAERVGPRLAIGWSMGAAASLLGMYFSYRFDAPTGATIICVFGALLIILSTFRGLFIKRLAC